MEDIKKEVEAILFSAGRTVLLKELQELLDLKNPGLVKEAISDLIKEYSQRDTSIMIVEENEGYKLTVKEQFLQVVQKINPHTELSRTVLETLAVVAWKQPMLQSDVIKIRTNKAYEHISDLERLGFIVREKHGRSFLIKVTQKFLDYFDLPNSKSIKEHFKNFKDIEFAVQKKVDEFETPQSDSSVLKDDSLEQQSLDEDRLDIDSESSEKVSSENEVETFNDELPPMPLVIEKEQGLESYGSAELIEETDSSSKESQEESSSNKVGSENKIIIQESESDKAKRLAKELLKPSDKVGADKESEIVTPSSDERMLHPALEDFLDEKELRAIKLNKETTPEPKVHESPESVSEETEDSSTSGEESFVDKTQSKDKNLDSDGASKEPHKPAEEYPGQFSENN